MLDFEKIRSRRGIKDDEEISGSKVRNEANFRCQEVSRGGTERGQVRMEPWTATAFRWAYPFGHFAEYPECMPYDVEKAITDDRDERLLTEDELVSMARAFEHAVYFPPTTVTALK